METAKLLNSEFLDILFDDRNKDYGAYDLRRKYDKRVRNAVMGMSAIVVIIIGGYAISTRLIASDKNHEVFIPYTPPEMENAVIEKEKPIVTPPPARQEPPPAAKPTIDAAIFKIAPDKEVKPDDEVPKNADLTDKVIGVANIAGDVDGVDFEVPDGMKGGKGAIVEGPKAIEKEKVFIFVEIMPEFPGGDKALMKFLNNNTRYPTLASETGIQGTVFVKFVVNKDGEIGSVVVEGAKKGGGLEEEAIRVVKKMPKWKPGKQNGEAVAVYFNLPVSFKLADQ